MGLGKGTDRGDEGKGPQGLMGALLVGTLHSWARVQAGQSSKPEKLKALHPGTQMVKSKMNQERTKQILGLSPQRGRRRSGSSEQENSADREEAV